MHRIKMKWFKASRLGGRSGYAKDWWFTLWERLPWRVRGIEKHQEHSSYDLAAVTTDVKCHHSLFAEGTVPKEFSSPQRFPVAP